MHFIKKVIQIFSLNTSNKQCTNIDKDDKKQLRMWFDFYFEFYVLFIKSKEKKRQLFKNINGYLLLFQNFIMVFSLFSL